MEFSHHPQIWSRYPELAAAALFVRGIDAKADVSQHVAAFNTTARQRLAAVESESELPEVNAWRRVFSRMGLKPTQYRCASESLLRRFRKEGELPAIHPLIDVCNAASLAYAIPVAALDVAKVEWPLQVRLAEGTERYLPFGGDVEHPDPGEVSFVDASGQAHARRWTHRQSGLSAVRDETRDVLVVMEAVHPGGRADVGALAAALAQAIASAWGVTVQQGRLEPHQPTISFG
ncbi:B3/B4 domain-containing protein [Ramlibacter sp. PS4R-6]|uniref:B3/B4 domain-containing protein n=1 Tax=Ramlibacter sp. PS4R-6 TaxID=3133438 RepID=UPI0030ACF169